MQPTPWAALVAAAHAGAPERPWGATDLRGGLITPQPLAQPAPCQPAAPAWAQLPIRALAPDGWLLDQLVTQANGLSGYLPKSTFPGAEQVNASAWWGGGGDAPFGGTIQWLPYWANGNIPLLELIRNAGAESRLDADARLGAVVDAMVDTVLSRRNATTGWLGPYVNEPGDTNGHGLWDPLNMLRALLYYAEAHGEREAQIASAVVGHLGAEFVLLRSDPVYKWASTRWPTFVQASARARARAALPTRKAAAVPLRAKRLRSNRRRRFRRRCACTSSTCSSRAGATVPT